MKLQLIETPDYILALSHGEMKEGDLYSDDTQVRFKTKKLNGKTYLVGTYEYQINLIK